jgi:two-component system NtrC family sensor kinase
MYFTPEGGSITITTGVDSETDRSGRGKEIQVTVTDTGAGIEPDIIDKIFDPFFTSKPVGEGTGLGLAISYKIIEEHEGSIEVMSSPGRGTSFVIRLPAGSDHD